MMFQKLVVIALVVIGALQINAAGNEDARGMRVVAEKMIAILRIIGEKVTSGFQECQPILEDIEAELNEALAEDVRKLFDLLTDDVDKIVNRIKTLEQEVIDASNAVDDEAKSCVDQVVLDVDKVKDVAEKNLSNLINDLLVKYDSNITSIKTQIVASIHDLDDATDQAIAAGVSCVKRGSANVKKCLDDNSNAWNSAVVSAVANLTLVLNELLALVQEVLPQVVDKVGELVSIVRVETDPAWSAFGDCVAALS